MPTITKSTPRKRKTQAVTEAEARLHRAIVLDRSADICIWLGRISQAEKLSHEAAALRRGGS